IGRGGEMLKTIGTRAREEMELVLGSRVYLDLRVKVLREWQRDPRALARLGFCPGALSGDRATGLQGRARGFGYHGGPGERRMMSQTAEIQPGGVGTQAFGPRDAARLVARTTAVDAVGLEERAASLGKRSIKRESKLWALDLAIRCTDLTTLEGADTAGKVVAMCAKAVRPNPIDPSIPSVAAVCLYPELVPV